MALKLIFEPALPIRLGCFTLQGLFLKRQQAAAVEIAALCKHHFLPQHELWTEVFAGEWSDRWRALLERSTASFLQQQLGMSAGRRVASALLLDDVLLQRTLTLVRSPHYLLPGQLPRCCGHLLHTGCQHVVAITFVVASVCSALCWCRTCFAACNLLRRLPVKPLLAQCRGHVSYNKDGHVCYQH